MQIVVLAGGLGTRLGPLTQRIPKSLVPVNGRPFLAYQLELFARSGLEDVVLCVGHLGEQIRAYAGDGSRFGVKVRYSEEGDQLLGTAGAVRNAEPLLGEEFFLTYGDSYLHLDYDSVLRCFKIRNALAMMVVYRNENRLESSNIVVDGEFVAVYDKQRRLPGMNWINFGVSLLRKEALQLVPAGVPYSQEAWCQDLIARRQLLAYETAQRFYEIGSPHGLAEFERLTAAGSQP